MGRHPVFSKTPGVSNESLKDADLHAPEPLVNSEYPAWRRKESGVEPPHSGVKGGRCAGGDRIIGRNIAGREYGLVRDAAL